MANILREISIKYNNKGLWEPSITCPDKALFVELDDYLKVFHDPQKYNCVASYIHNGECNLQGIYIPEYDLFIKEYSPRYFNVLKAVTPKVFTFIQIIPQSRDIISTGYSAEYISLRNIIKGCYEGSKLIQTVSDTHTYYIYHILKKYFNDITNYTDFLSRYVGDKGAELSARKGAGSLVNIEMQKHLRDRADFACISWDTYGEPPAGVGYFAGQIRDLVNITNDTQIWLDGGVNLSPM